MVQQTRRKLRLTSGKTWTTTAGCIGAQNQTKNLAQDLLKHLYLVSEDGRTVRREGVILVEDGPPLSSLALGQSYRGHALVSVADDAPLGRSPRTCVGNPATGSSHIAGSPIRGHIAGSPIRGHIAGSPIRAKKRQALLPLFDYHVSFKTRVGLDKLVGLRYSDGSAVRHASAVCSFIENNVERCAVLIKAHAYDDGGACPTDCVYEVELPSGLVRGLINLKRTDITGLCAPPSLGRGAWWRDVRFVASSGNAGFWVVRRVTITALPLKKKPRGVRWVAIGQGAGSPEPAILFGTGDAIYCVELADQCFVRCGFLLEPTRTAALAPTEGSSRPVFDDDDSISLATEGDFEEAFPEDDMDPVDDEEEDEEEQTQPDDDARSYDDADDDEEYEGVVENWQQKESWQSYANDDLKDAARAALANLRSDTRPEILSSSDEEEEEEEEVIVVQKKLKKKKKQLKNTYKNPYMMRAFEEEEEEEAEEAPRSPPVDVESEADESEAGGAIESEDAEDDDEEDASSSGTDSTVEEEEEEEEQEDAVSRLSTVQQIYELSSYGPAEGDYDDDGQLVVEDDQPATMSRQRMSSGGGAVTRKKKASSSANSHGRMELVGTLWSVAERVEPGLLGVSETGAISRSKAGSNSFQELEVRCSSTDFKSIGGLASDPESLLIVAIEASSSRFAIVSLKRGNLCDLEPAHYGPLRFRDVAPSKLRLVAPCVTRRAFGGSEDTTMRLCAVLKKSTALVRRGVLHDAIVTIDLRMETIDILHVTSRDDVVGLTSPPLRAPKGSPNFFYWSTGDHLCSVHLATADDDDESTARCLAIERQVTPTTTTNPPQNEIVSLSFSRRAVLYGVGNLDLFAIDPDDGSRGKSIELPSIFEDYCWI